MKKLLLLLAFLVPILLFAQNNAPKKNKSTVIVLHPLPGDRESFEQALAQHNNKFHKDQGQVDIYEVLAGDRTGEYHFVYRNPASWVDVENSFHAANEKDHSDDWNQNVAKHLADAGKRFFYEVSDDSYLPANPAEMHTDLMGVYLIDLNPGMESDFYSSLKKVKEMYKKSNSKDYYMIQSNMFGKGAQAVVIFPLAKGWASFEPNPDNDWSKMFKAAFPKEDYKAWDKKFNSSQKSFESMVVKHRKDLSSPL
ncbi:MAG: hypothetical protein ABI148_05990 [Ginsengibacter sp.]